MTIKWVIFPVEYMCVFVCLQGCQLDRAEHFPAVSQPQRHFSALQEFWLHHSRPHAAVSIAIWHRHKLFSICVLKPAFISLRRFLRCSDQDSPDPDINYEVCYFQSSWIITSFKTHLLSHLHSSAGVAKVERADSRRRVPLLCQREQTDR